MLTKFSIAFVILSINIKAFAAPTTNDPLADLDQMAEEILATQTAPKDNFDGDKEIEEMFKTRDISEPNIPQREIPKITIDQIKSSPKQMVIEKKTLSFPADMPLLPAPANSVKKILRGITATDPLFISESNLTTRSHFSIHGGQSSFEIEITTGDTVTISGGMQDVEENSSKKGVFKWTERADQDGQELQFIFPMETKSAFKISVPETLLANLRVETKGTISIVGNPNLKSLMYKKRFVRLISHENSVTIKNFQTNEVIKVSTFGSVTDQKKVGVMLMGVSGSLRVETGQLGFIASQLSGNLILYSNGGTALIKSSDLHARIKMASNAEHTKLPQVTLDSSNGNYNVNAIGDVLVQKSLGQFQITSEKASILLKNNRANIVAIAVKNIVSESGEGMISLYTLSSGSIKVQQHADSENSVRAYAKSGVIESDQPITKISLSEKLTVQNNDECEKALGNALKPFVNPIRF